MDVETLSDSDNDSLFGGGLTTTCKPSSVIDEALRASAETFELEQARRKSMQRGTLYCHDGDYDTSNTTEDACELEVSPPLPTTTATTTTKAFGLKLTSTGNSPVDPLDLSFSDDDAGSTSRDGVGLKLVKAERKPSRDTSSLTAVSSESSSTAMLLSQGTTTTLEKKASNMVFSSQESVVSFDCGRSDENLLNIRRVGQSSSDSDGASVIRLTQRGKRKIPAKRSRNNENQVNARMTMPRVLSSSATSTFDSDSDEMEQADMRKPPHTSHHTGENFQLNRKSVTMRLCSVQGSDSDSDNLSNTRLKQQSVRKPPPTHGSTAAQHDSDSDSDDSLLEKLPRFNRCASSMQTESTRLPAITSRVTGGKSKKQTTADQQREKQQKELEKQKLKEQKERDRQEKKNAKEQEKLERQRVRTEKKAAAESLKVSKKRQREESDQASGKRAVEELGILLEPELCSHPELTLANDLQQAGFAVDSYPSALGCMVIQYARLDFVKGGAARAIEMVRKGQKEEYEHPPFIGVVFNDAHDYLSKIERDSSHDEDDYPKLESFIRGLYTGWRAAWGYGRDKSPRIFIFLNQVNKCLEKLWLQSRKHNQTMRPPPSDDELQDSIIWLSIKYRIDCIHYDSCEDLSMRLTKMATWLARMPYPRLMTDLECVTKAKSQCCDLDPPLVRAQDCWKRQLCQLPHVSESMASSFVKYFPTMRSLYLRYKDPSMSEAQKVTLVADCFATSRGRQLKLSETIYRLITSKDPNELL